MSLRDMRRQLTASLPFAASSPISFDLPRDQVLRHIVLSAETAFSTGVGGALTGPIFDRAPWSAVKRIDLIADGKDTIKSFDGAMLLDMNHWDYGAYPHSQVAAIGASLSNGTTTKPLWHSLVIPLGATGMQRPQDTWLDARKLSSLELKVTFGAGLADIFTTVTAPATLDRFQITPWSHEILDVDPNSTFAVNQEVMTSTSFPTTTAVGRQFRLNVGNAYRRIFISTTDQNSRAAVDRLLRLVLTENGIFNRRIWEAGVLKQYMTLSHDMMTGMGVGPAPAASPTISTTQGDNGGTRSGLYVIDIAEDGSAGSMLDTRGYSDLSVYLDYDGANTTDLIRICSSIFLPNVR